MSDNEKGIWTINESGRYLKHYGPEKNWIVDSFNGSNSSSTWLQSTSN